MKRTFADLHLRTNTTDLRQVAMLTAKAAELGYKMVSTPLPPTMNLDEIRRLKAKCGEFGLDFASRLDIRPRNQNELLTQLRKMRRRFEIICVLCESKETARQAAKDRRVDLLSFPSLDYRRRFFDCAEAELAKGGNAALEIDTKPLLVLEGPQRVRFLSTLRREVSIALEFRVPVVISSGAAEPLLLRKPMETAMLTSLFGLQISKALDAISTNPVGMVERNRAKLKTDFVAPGIRQVKEGNR